jgi:N-acetylmuramoyl-L-alanine amidase
MSRILTTLAVVSATALLAGCAAGTQHSAAPSGPAPAVGAVATPHVRQAAKQVLAGKTIVIDPGHQLGNSTHPRQINRLVNAGGFMKACNTTGTATNGGFPEATFTWKVAKALRHQLRVRGARVVMTRHTNSYDDWGPCINVRGRTGNRVHADAVVSIHGDGAASNIHGFFVIRPANRKGWTDDIYRSSRRYSHRVRAGLEKVGLPPSNSYGGDGFSVRGDLGTLNWSNRPIVMVELGNMRNASDARHMTSSSFRRHVYARGLRLGITAYVIHH